MSNIRELNDILGKYTKTGERGKALSRFKLLSEALGNPHNSFKTIHIAGTNGKGSACAYISRALTAAGYKTGVFTSPYLVDITERIAVNGERVPKDELLRLCGIADNAASVTGTNGFSQFEILTAAGFIYFAEQCVDYAVVETGIGGLLDCTNVVTPEVSVITSVSFDHRGVLGGTIGEIAYHKAGIIKQGVPVVTCPRQSREALRKITQAAEEKQARLIIPDRSKLRIENRSVFGNAFVYKKQNLATKMGGEHQIYNALTAYETLSLLGVSEAAIALGLREAVAPARMQIISHNPLFIVDGAHNPAGLKAAAAGISPLPMFKVVIMGILSEKDRRKGIKELASTGAAFVLTDGFSPDAASCSELAVLCAAAGVDEKNIYTVSDAEKALRFAGQLAGVSGAILVTGSLYLAGKIFELM